MGNAHDTFNPAEISQPEPAVPTPEELAAATGDLCYGHLSSVAPREAPTDAPTCVAPGGCLMRRIGHPRCRAPKMLPAKPLDEPWRAILLDAEKHYGCFVAPSYSSWGTL